MNILLLLAQLAGIRAIVNSAQQIVLFAVRVVFSIAVLLGLAFIAYESRKHWQYYLWVAALFIAWQVFAWWRNREPEPEPEHTIEGKLVPEVLASAALDMPGQSPDSEKVLRGIPDYAKTLLRLPPSEFEFVPEPEPEETPERFSQVKEAVTSKRFRMPRWAMKWATGFAVVVVCLFLLRVYEIHRARVDARFHLLVPDAAEVDAMVARKIAAEDAAAPDKIDWKPDEATGDLDWPAAVFQNKTYNQAIDACKNGNFVAADKHWRLPTLPELQAHLYAEGKLRDGLHVQPDLFLWTSDNRSRIKQRGESVPVVYETDSVNSMSVNVENPNGAALCVHD